MNASGRLQNNRQACHEQLPCVGQYIARDIVAKMNEINDIITVAAAVMII